MKEIDAYFYKLLPNQAALGMYLLEVITRVSPQLTVRMAYGLPFIYYKKYMCYLNCTKHGVDVGFAQGNQLVPRPQLIVGKRKMVRSVFYPWEAEVDEALLRELVMECMNVQDRSQ